ncbi:hypothetical protein GQ602_003419 [Ophiocordyceps camponoti-floridani]|uniref:Uncharacterized protein n=1 Tax=Ophiocordyceps camponoti-floridani TaxID=2030778 RepID=A0A8H4VEA4_9HYPO|nr:hypothetical protein GQ602_003419 [Ophiocordyceps camponoti-floridani]
MTSELTSLPRTRSFILARAKLPTKVAVNSRCHQSLSTLRSLRLPYGLLRNGRRRVIAVLCSTRPRFFMGL